MSNLYTLTNGTLSMSPDRMFQTTPLIKLGALHFQKVGITTLKNSCKIMNKIKDDYMLTYSSNHHYVLGQRVLVKILVDPRYPRAGPSYRFWRCHIW